MEVYYFISFPNTYIMLLPVTGLPDKKPSTTCGITWRHPRDSSKMIQAMAISLGCLQELDGKTAVRDITHLGCRVRRNQAGTGQEAATFRST